MISVVIPLYNKEKSIARTIDCVLSQTYQNFEVVVVDDGSTDNSAAIVKTFKDPRIRLICQPNGGVSAARNTGIREAKGEYVAFLDADDEWDIKYLKTQFDLITNNPQCSVYATNYQIIDHNGNIKSSQINKLHLLSESGEINNYFEICSCSSPLLCSSSVVVRKEAILSVNGFPVGIKSGEDLLTWARLACKYRIAYSKKTLAFFYFDYWEPDEDQKSRPPEKNDFVGQNLKKLCDDNKNIHGLKGYLASWHKMRARRFFDRNEFKKMIKECYISLTYKFDIKVILYILLSFIPKRIKKKIVKIYYS